MRRVGFPVAQCEGHFRRALQISRGDYSVFVTRPLSRALLLIAALAVVGPLVYRAIQRQSHVATD